MGVIYRLLVFTYRSIGSGVTTGCLVGFKKITSSASSRTLVVTVKGIAFLLIGWPLPKIVIYETILVHKRTCISDTIMRGELWS